MASNGNHVDLMRYLIKQGADLEKVSIYGKPINWAAGARSIEAAILLLESGAHPDGDTTGTIVSPLILAVDFNEKKLYDLLMEKGGNIMTKDP